jgi:hypothetical protein
MYDFERFGPRQMMEASKGLRQLGRRSDCMEEAAVEVVDYLFKKFQVEGKGEPACVMVRCFKTERYSRLPEDLQAEARRSMQDGEPWEAMPCMALLASRGVMEAWNGRRGSKGHQAIPLATAAMLEEAPMIARLIAQLGLESLHLVKPPSERLVAMERQALNVFHVEEALGSEFVPAQEEFVIPYGVRSALGFGGVLPGGELYCVLMFAKVRIRMEVAEMFPTLGLGVKMALMGHAGGRIFV